MRIFNVSASKIKAYKSCEFKYYLEYHRKLPQRVTFAAEQGTMIHVVLEKFGEAKKDNIIIPEIANTWYDEILHAYQENGIWKLSSKALERRKECNNCEYHKDGRCFVANAPIDSFDGCPKTEFDDAIWLVEKIIKDDTNNNPLNKKVIDVENDFEICINDNGEEIPLIGIIDVVTELDKDTIEIIDYKTGTYTQSYNECTKDPQLLIYHLAARKIFKNYKNIFVTIYYLRKSPMTLSFSEKDEIGTENAIKNYWNAINENIHPKRRCDRRNGIYFDHVCKYLCNPELCNAEHKKYVENNYKMLDTEPDVKIEEIQWMKTLKKEERKNK